MKLKKVLILLTLIFSVGNLNVCSEEKTYIENLLADTANYLYETVKNPQVGSIGGEWAIIGLARSGYEVPDEYYHNYYRAVCKYVKDRDGVLHDKKYTEYSRVILALTSIGKNPADVEGYNLLEALSDYEKTIRQGINGPVWALIALDSGNYEIPENPEAKIRATRELYIKIILECQNADGGWSLNRNNEASDPDITGMTLQALAKYSGDDNVKEAIEKALSFISLNQSENGGFSSWETENSESCVQVLVALCELGISANDSRFVKNGKTLVDNLITYYEKGNGFKHTYNGTGSNLMATEQGLYALAALKRFSEDKNSLYRMSDAISFSEKFEDNSFIGLPGKHPDVRKVDVVFSEKTFSDIAKHPNRYAIEALAVKNIINGKSKDMFEPDATMTRAEFAAIIVKGLGLPDKSGNLFIDVPENEWYFDYINTANSYGIVNGVSENEFNPNGTITREEAAVMITRAAKLCGMNTDLDNTAVRDILAVFYDYVKAADWSVNSLAFCYDNGILTDEEIEIKPKEAVKRAEIALMLFNTLNSAGLGDAIYEKI